MRPFRYLLCTLFLSCCAWQHSTAQQPVVHKLSLTVSPIHLLMPLVELTGEFNMNGSTGVAGILGIGSYKGSPVYEVGGQLNYYAVGDFEGGMQLGAELLYLVMTDTYEDRYNNLSYLGTGLALSPYIGYKTAAIYGLTFNGQIGAGFYLVQDAVEDNGSGRVATGSEASVTLMLNLNIGWSF